MIICAAIKIQSNPNNIVICGYRHQDCYALFHQLNPSLSRSCRRFDAIEEGFLTTDNKFLNRTEAFNEAKNCGQIPTSLYEYKISHKES